MSSFGERLKKSRNQRGITQSQLSERLGVAQSTIANYEKNIRFPGNEILKDISEYLQISVDFLMGIDINESKNIDSEMDMEKIQNEFLDLLLKGNSNKAKDLIKKVHNSGVDVLKIITIIFIPTLKKIGDLWETNQVSIGQEHYSSAIIEKLLDYLSESEVVKEENLYKALFMVPGGEEHTLTLKMAAEFFRRSGWTIIFIGRSIPLDSIIDLINIRKPDLIVLSVLTSSGYNSCGYLVKALKSELSSKTPFVLVGGQGVVSEDDAINNIGADLYLETLDNLKDKIRLIESKL